MCQTTIHPFEKAGLGKAPFHYVGMVEQEMKYGERVIGSVGGIEITTKPGGTCEFCGHYILNIFMVESSDGKRFKVGCDCIKKVGDNNLVKLVSKDVKKMKEQREVARIQEAKAALPTAHKLFGQSHPNAYHASQGKTMVHYLEWMFKNAGRSGQLQAARIIEAAISPVIQEE